MVLAEDSTDSSEDKAPESLHYGLFDGIDLQVELDGEMHPIVGFTKKKILIARNGSRDPLSTDSKISYSLRSKLSRKWVDLKILKTERFYSQMNADFAAYSSAVNQQERTQGARQDYALGRRPDDFVEHINGPRPVAVPGEVSKASELEAKLVEMDKYADSLKVSLALIAPDEYKGVYLVVVARIDSPGTEPESRPFIQIVGRLKEDQKRKVEVVFENLPMGFTLLGIEVRVYSQGEEIPHAGSPGLKRLTEEEAFQYSLSKYKSGPHHSEPELFRALPSEEISSFLSKKEIQKIKADLVVHPDGSTTVDYLNTEDPIKRRLVGLIEDVRFVPAIENGVPTEARISLQLSNLVD
ncbi:MAG: hypothetical protein KJT03_10520 [Verrucomicrobiae bacterium]|nr:hypothetical protein [Verrucomicrobiae bacterium]